MSKRTGLGINVVLDTTQDIINVLPSCLCLYFNVCEQEKLHTLYEVIVHDHIDYFVYEIWIIEQPKLVKRFQKEITISLIEFRENFYVNVTITHERIAEKYIRQGTEFMNENKVK